MIDGVTMLRMRDEAKAKLPNFPFAGVSSHPSGKAPAVVASRRIVPLTAIGPATSAGPTSICPVAQKSLLHRFCCSCFRLLSMQKILNRK